MPKNVKFGPFIWEGRVYQLPILGPITMIPPGHPIWQYYPKANRNG